MFTKTRFIIKKVYQQYGSFKFLTTLFVCHLWEKNLKKVKINNLKLTLNQFTDYFEVECVGWNDMYSGKH